MTADLTPHDSGPRDLVTPRRVNLDQLDFDEDLGLLDGEPFTGTAFALHPDGAPAFEGGYLDGLPDGVQREWFANGRPARRWVALRGRGAAESWTWWEGGGLRSYRRDADQRPVELHRWDEAGRPEEVAPLPAPGPAGDSAPLAAQMLQPGSRSAAR